MHGRRTCGSPGGLCCWPTGSAPRWLQLPGKLPVTLLYCGLQVAACAMHRQRHMVQLQQVCQMPHRAITCGSSRLLTTLSCLQEMHQKL